VGKYFSDLEKEVINFKNMDPSINIDHSIKEEIKEELVTEDNVYDTISHFAGNLQFNETDSIKSEIDIVDNLEIDAEMINVDFVTDIEREIANFIKNEVDEEISDIKSEPSILVGETHVKSSHKAVQHNCKFCEYKSTTKGNLQKHIKSVHEGVRYSCELCDYKATHSSHLKRHVKSVHKGIKLSDTKTFKGCNSEFAPG